MYCCVSLAECPCWRSHRKQSLAFSFCERQNAPAPQDGLEIDCCVIYPKFHVIVLVVSEHLFGAHLFALSLIGSVVCFGSAFWARRLSRIWFTCHVLCHWILHCHPRLYFICVWISSVVSASSSCRMKTSGRSSAGRTRREKTLLSLFPNELHSQ
jgi:hypothetical protein